MNPFEKTILVVDGMNILFRSFYAIAPMSNQAGIPTNALFGFIRSITKVINELNPSFVIIVFDGPDNKKSRTTLFADYKSHRKEMPEELVKQLPLATEWSTLAGIPQLSLPGVEADDTIGSIALWAEKKKFKTILYSSDKDLCQLISPYTQLLMPHKENSTIGSEEVKQLFGVDPSQMIDYLAIVGDASDNIPGLTGFGPKAAASLLLEFGSLENLLSQPDKVKGATKQKTLREEKEIALLSKKLATIQTDLPIPTEETFYEQKKGDLSQLESFYKHLRLFSLLKQESYSDNKAQPQYTHKIVTTQQDLASAIDSLLPYQELYIDTLTPLPESSDSPLLGIGLGSSSENLWYIPAPFILQNSSLKTLLQNRKLIGHNIKKSLHALAQANLPTPEAAFDSMIAAYLLYPHHQKHTLDLLSIEHLNYKKSDLESFLEKEEKPFDSSTIPLEKMANYCSENLATIQLLKKIFEKKLSLAGLNPLFYDIELPLIHILFKMEDRGIFLEKTKLETLAKELSSSIQKLSLEIFEIAGSNFNLNSPKQLSKVLFEDLNIKKSKKREHGFATDADSLEGLKTESPIIPKILEYRSLEKLRSTYVEKLPLSISPKTGRIHCSFNQSVAATGRLSCQNPNLQNIPIKSDEGKKIREAFSPKEPNWRFVAADYSQIELRLLAHFSEDPKLLSAFSNGEDVHAHTAATLFNIPIEEVSDDLRRKAKAVNFGILYGQQAFGLSQGLQIDFKEAASFIQTYFERYTKVKEYIEFCKETARQEGCARTITGRIRPIPDISSKNPALRSAAERLAINTPLQGSAADLIKLAMLAIDNRLQKQPTLGYLLLQIHDELLFETPEESVAPLSQLAKTTMETVFQLKIPLIVNVSIGKNWGEC